MDAPIQAWRPRPRACTIGLLAVAVLLAVTAVAGRSRADTAADRPTPEALVQGVFFGLGPFAERHPALVLSRVAAEPGENTAEVTDLIAETGRRVPVLFDRFASTLYGGDRVAIRATAIETGRELENTLLRRHPQAFDLTAGGLCNVQAGPYLPSGLYLYATFPVVLWITNCPDVVARDPADRRLDLDIWTDAVATTLTYDPEEDR